MESRDEEFGRVDVESISSLTARLQLCNTAEPYNFALDAGGLLLRKKKSEHIKGLRPDMADSQDTSVT